MKIYSKAKSDQYHPKQIYSTLILSFALISLITPVKYDFYFFILRPFEIFILLWLIVILLRGANLAVSYSLLTLLPYLILHIALSVPGGIENFLREFGQALLISLFSLLLFVERQNINFNIFGKVLLYALIIIILFTIGYHFMDGQYTGWKSLNETKYAFVFILPIIASSIIFGKKAYFFYVIWILMLPIIVMSGERKALLIYIVLSGILMSRGRIFFIVLICLILLTCLQFIYVLVDDEYVRQQLRSILDPSSTGNFRYMLYNFSYAPGDTPSNTFRAFTLWMSAKIFLEYPIFGIGTNQYEILVDANYNQLPIEMLFGIHGEFQRVLTENGIVGFALYSLIWIFAWYRSKNVAKIVCLNGLVSYWQFRCLNYVFFSTALIFVATEASGMRSFVVLAFIAFLPDLLKGNFFNQIEIFRHLRKV